MSWRQNPTRDKLYSIIYIISSLIFLAREHLCALLDTTTQDDNQDFRSDYSSIHNLLELNESLDYYDQYICY